MKPLLALLASALLVVGVTACGSGTTSGETPAASSPSATTATTGASPAHTTATGATAPSAAKSGSSSSAERAQSGSSHTRSLPQGDNSIRTYGNEAGEADKQAVTTAVKRYYTAVSSGDGATACSLLSTGLSKSIVQSFGRAPTLRGKGCAGILSLLFKSRPNQARSSLAAVEVTGVRIKGNRGFALIRSKTMPSGEISVDREGGSWRIGALIGGSLG